MRKPAKMLLSAALAAALAAMPIVGSRATDGLRLPAKLDPEILADYTSGRAIVGFDHDVTAGTIRRLAAAGATHAVRLDTIDAVGIVGPLAAYETIARWSDVEYVDADSPISFDNYAAKKDSHVDKVRAGKGVDAKYNGKGVTVAVIDTGVDYNHPDLADRVVRSVNFEPAWIFDMIQDGTYSDQIAEATGNPIDSYGHGTHVAGIVAGTGAAASGDADMSGVAPGASIANLKIADVHQGVDCSIPCDLGWEINALVAYEYAIEHRNDKVYPGGIRIINNSWSTYEVDSEVEPISLIVEAAARKGLINVFAAGNDGPGDNTVAQGPNQLEEVITVAAACKSVDSCGEKQIAGFSSRGPQVDIAAPGDNIYSTAAVSVFTPLGSHAAPGGGTDNVYYVGLSGTSMATPHVSGIIALMLDANPKLTYKQVEKILISTAWDYGDPGFDTAFGFGQVDALKAVAKAENL